MRSRALLLVGLLVLGALPLHLAGAGSPESAGWSPFTAPEAVTAVALSKNALTLAVGNAAVTDRNLGGGVVPGVGTSNVGAVDFRAFNLTLGRLFNSTDAPNGKQAVAVSADGKVAVAAGKTLTGHEITFYRVAGAAPPPPGGTAPGSQSPLWKRAIGGPATAIAASGDGKVVAVAFNTGSGGRVLVYDDGGNEVVTFTDAERVMSVDVSADGKWIVAGGGARVADQRRGAVWLFEYPTDAPRKTTLLAGQNASEVRGVRITPDGATYAAVAVGGQVAVLANRGASTGDPVTFGALSDNVTAKSIAMSADGRWIAYSRDKTFTLLRRNGTALEAAWSYAAESNVNSLDMNATGAVIVAGTAGATGGVVAFSPASATPYWRVAGGAQNVTVTANGEWVAFARGQDAHAMKLVRKLSILYETSPGVGSNVTAAPTGQPGRSLVVPLIVKNEGAIPERVEITLPTAGDSTFSVRTPRFSLVPNEFKSLPLTIVPGRLPPGPQAFNVSARSLDSGAQYNLTVRFNVAPLSELDVKLNGAPERRIGPNQNDSVSFSVFNNGNSPSQVAVEVQQRASAGRDWQVRLLGESRFSLAPGGLSTVRLLVSAPPDAVNGSTNLVTLNVRTSQGTTSADVLYSVNPFVAVNVTGPGGSRTLTKFAQPGRTVQFNLTVANTGSIAAQFEASHDLPRVTGGKPNWVVTHEVAPFTLAPGENRTVPVRVFAPEDAVEGDGLTVTVEVSNVVLTQGVNQARENVTLFVNVQSPPPTTTPRERGIPAPSLTPVLALALALALSQKKVIR